jgi:hypothetical protein
MTESMKGEVVEKIALLMASAFGLIAALAWNDAIKGLFAPGGPLYLFAASGPWFYAIIVTVIAVTATIIIGVISKKVK